MKSLTRTQTLYIDNDLKAKGLSDGFRNELLDHICCMVEQELQSDKNFSEAYKMSLEFFGEKGFNELKKIKHTKHRSFPNKLITGIAACILLTVVVVDAQDRPTIHPLYAGCKVSSHYGARVDPIKKVKRNHNGIDFPVPIGTDIKATADGIVKSAESDGAHGINIIISHGDGFETRYSHLSKSNVSVGQEVAKGEIIALSGNSGMSTAPHLHYEVIKDGEYVDPIDYMVAK